MNGITCFDTITNAVYPKGAVAYAAYIDGHLGNQPNFGYIVSAFPKARHFSITLLDGDADAADVENGAMTPGEVPGWHGRQVARGISRPIIYASTYMMQEEIFPVLIRAGIHLASTRLWTAHYGLGEHICGPTSCRALDIDADGTQWSQFYGGVNLDASLLAADFFGPVTPVTPPADWVFGPVRGLTLAGTGPDSVKLSWSSPGTPMPLGIGHYEVALSQGTRLGPVYKSYPREVPKLGPSLVTWQGDDLAPSTEYVAAVRAIATDGGHASPWAELTFTTKPAAG